MDGVRYCVLEVLFILQFFTITRQEETVCTAEFRLDLCQTEAKPGSALVEHPHPYYRAGPILGRCHSLRPGRNTIVSRACTRNRLCISPTRSMSALLRKRPKCCVAAN